MMPLITVHSSYSLLEGVNPPAALAARAADTGCTALVLCDHNLLTGAVEFALACRKAGVKPIFGLETDVAFGTSRQGHEPISRLSLLAETEKGWANLCQLSSFANLEDGRPITSRELAEHTQGVICLTGGIYGIANLVLRQGFLSGINLQLEALKNIFKGNLFFRLTCNPSFVEEERILLSLMAQAGIQPVLAPEVLYLDKSDEPVHRLLCSIRSQTTNDKVDVIHGYTKNIVFPDPVFLQTSANQHTRAQKLALEIQERCNFQMPFGIPRFPAIPLPQGITVSQALRERAFSGASRLYSDLTPEITQRLDYELNIIAGLGYDPIFLIMEELLTFARKQGILFSSRGSAASSLVAHCLGITFPDPIRLSLYFERFLNPARTSPPDIDTDIDSRRRDEVIHHCFEKYGKDRVAMVATINRFRPRSAVGEAAKALGFSPAESRKLAAELPYFFFAGRMTADEPGGEENVFRDLSARYPDPRHQELFAIAARILGLPRHLSVHPGGVVISPGPMTELVPVMRSGGKGVQISQFDLESLAYLGLVKIDLLGIRGLTVMADVMNAIHSWSKADYSSPAEIIAGIPLDDIDTGQIITAGKTIGCFQIESPGMRATLKSIHARTPDDVMAALALYRPGPMRGGLRDAFIRRHNGEEAVTHLHPSLERTLGDTYGVILYQEQVLRIAHEIGGLTLTESDLLRRAMSHFDPGKQMELLKDKFIQGTGEFHSVPSDLAEQIWEMMAAFAGYGFPKAHAASYARVAWNSAWCKAHFPAEFLAGVLANWGGYYSQRVYLMEARRLGFAPKPPHINHANRECTVTYPDGKPALYLGLDQVKDLTNRTMQKIIALRPFKSLDDLLTRVDPRPVEIRNLIRCGALYGMGSIPSLLAYLEKGRRQAGQPSLFEEPMSDSLPELGVEDRIAAQQEILGIGVDAHPLDLYADRLAQFNSFSTVEALEYTGKHVTVVGVRQSHRRSRTNSGDWMAFLTIEDFEGTLDVILFPNVYRSTPREVFSTNLPIIIEGVIESDSVQTEPFLRAESVYLVK